MENYDVELFEDGASALKSIQLRAPDAVVLDLQLPTSTGWRSAGAFVDRVTPRPS